MLLEFFDDALDFNTNIELGIASQSFPAAELLCWRSEPSANGINETLSFAGDIAEIMIYSGAVTDSDRLSIVNYLKQKYYQVNGPGLTFQWKFNETNLSGATNATLTLPDIQATEAGAYSVVVSNVYGMVISSNALLVVKEIPVILTQSTNQTVPAYQPLTLSDCQRSQPLPYQWTFDGAAIAGATNSTLVLANPIPGQSGTYSVTLGAEPYTTTGSNITLLIQITPKS